jgi:hypothetical protein
MKRLVAAVAACILAAIPTATFAPAEAAITDSAVQTAAATALTGTSMRARFAREVVRKGDQDTSTRRIEHVRELQYRLKWAGAYRGPVTGYFGDLTQAAVKRYQRRENIKASGVATRATWTHLIPDSTRRRSAVPGACDRGRGWDACYDRKSHQVTLWRGGRLHNAWLVRGGGRGMETRTGHFRVYWRNIDHVSSLYNSPMPYSQFFSGGQAFHGSTYMMDPFSGHSHGCVNMYIEDARQLWSLTSDVSLGVHVYGRWS